MEPTTIAPLAPEGLAHELAGRHRRLASDLQARGAACLVATRNESVTFLTGYTTMTWRMQSRPVIAVLTAGGRLTVIAAETEADSVRLRVPGATVSPYVELRTVRAGTGLPDGPIQFSPHAAEVLGNAIEEAGAGTVAVDGLDAVWPPIGQLVRLLPSLAGRVEDASELVWQRRLVKTRWEVERMRHAAAVLDRAHEKLREQLRPGMSELDIARRFMIAQLEAGAHEAGPLAAVADPSRGLFGFPTHKVWEGDELLYIDGAAIVDGYWSDYCRTYSARPPSASHRQGYARVLEGLRAALALDPVGATAGQIGEAMGEAMGLSPHEVGFSRFGHGIGIHVPEPPSLHGDDPTVLEAGFTLCIEPAVCHDGVNFVVEEEHLVTEAGFEPLSPLAPTGIVQL